jgi:hypothetical protein
MASRLYPEMNATARTNGVPRAPNPRLRFDSLCCANLGSDN